MEDKDLIFVLGYGRSGTSALTRVISLCGCSLPDPVFGATDLNPTGHWEPVESTRLNVEFISRLGLVDDPSMRLEEIHIDEDFKEAYISDIQAFLSRLPLTPVVIKDYQINELTEFWLEAARRTGFSVKTVIALRHPQEVYASIVAGASSFRPQEASSPTTAAPLSVEKSNTFWLKVNLQAERHSRYVPRVFVEYSNLMKDWRKEIARISKALAVDLQADERAIDSFLTPDLHRQRYVGPIVETFGYSWTTRVYAILSSAAQDGLVDVASLDEIYHAYRTNVRAFRLSLESVRTDAEAQRLRKFVDQLPIWQSKVDF
jgi:hypothetical protein